MKPTNNAAASAKLDVMKQTGLATERILLASLLGRRNDMSDYERAALRHISDYLRATLGEIGQPHGERREA